MHCEHGLFFYNCTPRLSYKILHGSTENDSSLLLPFRPPLFSFHTRAAASSLRGGQGVLGKLKHLLGGERGGCLGTYKCSKHTSMVFFRGPPLDVSFLAYTRLVVLSQPRLPLLGLRLGQGHTIALHKGKQ